MVLFRVVCLSLLMFMLPVLARAAEPLTLGVHPYLPATEIVKRFSPLAGYLEGELERPVQVVISRDYRHHIDLVGTDKLDIAFMGPASYVKMVSSYGRKPILARLEVNGSPYFRGAIITRKDSSLEKLSDLRGKRFAFGDPDSTMSHLVPRHMLAEAGVTVAELAGFEFLSSHHNVALGVLMGDFDAGAVKEEVFEAYEERGLRVLAWTPEISEHLLVVSAKLPQATVRELKRALFQLKYEPECLNVMSAIKEDVTDLVPAQDSDYENLRRILRALDDRGIRP